MAGVGKRVGDELYVHLSSLDQLADSDHRALIHGAVELLPADARGCVNVAKVNVRTSRVALLAYPAFDADPFPALATSWSRQAGNGTALTLRSYADSLNPPILHRKELLVHPGHAERARWAAITVEAEGLGLFDDPKVIGFRVNWERAIAGKGYRLSGEQFVPVGNVADDDASLALPLIEQPVQRHLTALARSAISAPVQLLLRHGLLSRDTSFFDYGCGRGDDVAALSEEGFAAAGWDPYYAADRERAPADVVNVGFVVNVIEDPAERVEVLRRAFELTKGVMAVGVMLYGPEAPGRTFRDGFLTSRGTFQKYFNQAELKDYLEHVLHQEAILVGPGVALVFADKEWEQRFLAGRYRRTDLSIRLIAARARVGVQVRERPSARRPAVPSAAVEPHPLLHALWRLSLDLGRFPEEAEVDILPQLIEAFGSLPRALRKVDSAFDHSLLEQARAARSDDLRLYFAMQQFSKRPRYRQLEVRLQRDVKAFFGDYAQAQAAGLSLLAEAAEPSSILRSCQDAAVKGLGWLDGDHSLQLHVSLIDRLPLVLRAFASCGLLVYGDLSGVDLVKIHIGSGKLTLMQFDDFASSPTPLMSKRIKVNVRRADYEVFEYGGQYPKPLLYHKSRYLHEEVDRYPEQLAFDEALEATGLLDDSEFGPSAEDLAAALRLRRLEIEGLSLRRSSSIPDLDERCGVTFTYRQLIECGETQARLGLSNVPRNPESFNALYDLATKLLDPIVEYFGAIRLTYGFCSPELGAHIKARVAPDLDQHAAHETNGRGLPICARGGAACDFIVDDESMEEVAEWVMTNLPFDRLYFYGMNRPIHISYGPGESRQAFEMVQTPTGRQVPRRYPAPVGGPGHIA